MKKKIINIASIVIAVLLLVAVLLQIIAMYAGAQNATYEPVSYFKAVGNIFAAIFGIYYILAGCKKAEGAEYFRWFMIFFAILQLIMLLGHKDTDTVSVLCMTVTFGIMLVLSIAKDLGQKRSLILALCVLVLTAIRMIALAVAGNFATDWIFVFTQILLALTCFVMILAKYQDKKDRGRKV